MQETNPKHLLLLEDVAEQRAVTEANLRAAGLTVSSVSTLAEAVAWLAENAVDVILMDLGLPDAFGLQAAHQIVGLQLDVPFVVLSANDDAEVGLAAIQLGAEDVLVKGVDEHRIVRAIQFALKRHERQAALQARAGYLERVFNESPSSLLILDENFRVQYANHAAGRVYGRDAALLVGEQLVRHMPDDKQVELRVAQPGGKEKHAVATSRSLTVGAATYRLVSLREVPGE